MKQYIKGGQIKTREEIVIITNDSTIINPAEEEILNDGWKVYEEPVLYTPTMEEKIEQAKREILYQINAYDRSDNVNAFIIGGKKHWLDYTGRCKVEDRCKMDIKDGVETTPLSIDGDVFPMTPQKGLELIDLLNHYATKCYDCTENHKHNIKYTEWTTDEEVINYNYKVGYPNIINFDLL